MKTEETKVELYKQLIALEFESEDFLLQLGDEAFINDEFNKWLEDNAYHYFMQMRRTHIPTTDRPILTTMSRAERRALLQKCSNT